MVHRCSIWCAAARGTLLAKDDESRRPVKGVPEVRPDHDLFLMSNAPHATRKAVRSRYPRASKRVCLTYNARLGESCSRRRPVAELWSIRPSRGSIGEGDSPSRSEVS
jgi:hypothetical protein